MTLKEALDSGRMFTRPGYEGIEFKLEDRNWSTEEILSEDWYIIEKAISITRHDFFKAIADTMREEGIKHYGPYGIKEPKAGDLMAFKDWSSLAEKLGFKNDI
jgi:hypothetical protein